MTRTNDPTDITGRELTITRVFDAPRDLVFNIWTQPMHINQWWGPRDYTTLSSELHLHPGGSWSIKSRHTDRSEVEEGGVFQEIVEPKRLVFTHAWQSEEGSAEQETFVTISFAERDGKTTMEFHQAGFSSVESRDGHIEGWSQSFDMLAEHIKKI
jgi:uncharacterized protein YndB with AHSA1/START domain